MVYNLRLRGMGHRCGDQIEQKTVQFKIRKGWEYRSLVEHLPDILVAGRFYPSTTHLHTKYDENKTKRGHVA